MKYITELHSIPLIRWKSEVPILQELKCTKNRHFFSLIFNDYDDGVQVKIIINNRFIIYLKLQ